MSAGVSCPQETQIRLACTLQGNPRPAPRFLVMCVFSQPLTKVKKRESMTVQRCNCGCPCVYSILSHQLQLPLSSSSDQLLAVPSPPCFLSSPLGEQRERERQLSHLFSFCQGVSLLLQADLLKSFPKGSSFPRGKTEFISI